MDCDVKVVTTTYTTLRLKQSEVKALRREIDRINTDNDFDALANLFRVLGNAIGNMPREAVDEG